MKRLNLLLMLFALLGFVLSTEAQTLVIKSSDGTLNDKTLSLLRKFTFENDNLLLNYIDGTTETYTIPTIEKLYFESVPVGVETYTSSASKISAYPNPVESTLHLKNISDQSATVLIYRTDGKLVQSSAITSGENSVDVNQLNSGFYILRVNGQSLKFMKR